MLNGRWLRNDLRRRRRRLDKIGFIFQSHNLLPFLTAEENASVVLDLAGWPAEKGRALFGGADMGAVVPFVLWFNFGAGFAYVAAGLGLCYQTGWATGLAIAIALATAAVFAAFLWHVSTGAAFEARTMGAMGLRLAIWVMIAIVARASGKVRRS